MWFSKNGHGVLLQDVVRCFCKKKCSLFAITVCRANLTKEIVGININDDSKDHKLIPFESGDPLQITQMSKHPTKQIEFNCN